MKNKCIAIIPARKNSKRIKNKNIKKFFGKPIIYHTIKAAKESKCFDKIIVSTNCHKISKISRSYGADIDFIRPNSVSNDGAKTISVIKHALNFYKKKGINYKYACCLYPASPFIKKKNLIKSLNILKKKKINLVITLQEHPSPIQKALKISKQSKITWYNDSFASKNSNKISKSYFDSGQFYFGTSNKFLYSKNIIDVKTKAIILKKYESLDLNEIEDWKFAEKIYSYLNNISR